VRKPREPERSRFRNQRAYDKAVQTYIRKLEEWRIEQANRKRFEEEQREQRRRTRQEEAAREVALKISELVTGTPASTIEEQMSRQYTDYSQHVRQDEGMQQGNTARDAANDRADRGRWSSDQ